MSERNKKKTTDKLASQAASILSDNKSSKISKSLAASVLTQSGNEKQTSAEMEKIASKVLKSDKYSKENKALAGSVLSQSNKKR